MALSLGLLGASIYYLARFKGKTAAMRIPMCIIVITWAVAFWILRGGIFGFIPLGFYMIIIILLGFLPPKQHFPAVGIIFFIFASLILWQYLYPDQFVLDRTDQEIVIDNFILWAQGVILAGGILWFIKSRFEKERSIVIRKNEELSDFAHIVSHDLKAPLRGMQHLSKFVLEDYHDQLTPESREMLEKVVSSADRMTIFINDVLTFTRVSENLMDKEEIDMNELLDEIVTFLNPSETITIRYAGLPRKVFYNRIALHQVLLNLITNAIKYNDKDYPIIEVLSNQKGRYYWVGVKDNGPGIAPEHHATIFEFLKTLGNKSRGESGTGIGLAMVKKIVEQNEGDIKLESMRGKGATFWVSIPV